MNIKSIRSKYLLSLVLCSLILFAWNAFSWMVLPFHGESLQTLPEQITKFTEMSSVKLSDGVYHYPGLPQDNSPESLNDIKAKLADGPIIPLMVYKSGPSTLFNPSDFAKSFLFNVLAVCALLFIFSNLKNIGWKHTAVISIVVGLLVGFSSDLPLMVWYKLPLNFILPSVFDHLIGVLLVGTVYSLIFKDQE